MAYGLPPGATSDGHQFSRHGRRRKKLERSDVAKTRKTEKTVEIHEVYVIRRTSGALPALCSQCSNSGGVLVTPEEAAAIAKVSVRAIYRWVEADVVHYRNGPDGSVVVCTKSLPITLNSK